MPGTGDGSRTGFLPPAPVALRTMRSSVARMATSASPFGRNAKLKGCGSPRTIGVTRIRACSAVSNVYDASESVSGLNPMFACCAVLTRCAVTTNARAAARETEKNVLTIGKEASVPRRLHVEAEQAHARPE